MAEQMQAGALLEVRSLRKQFAVERGALRKVVGQLKAVDDVTFSVAEGEVLGIVGESGCGKTTLGRCILRAIEPTSGQVRFRQADGSVMDVTALDRNGLRAFRRQTQIVFQNPYGSLDPRMTVLDIVGEPIVENGVARGKVLEGMVRDLVKRVGLDDRHINRYPHAFSGGQRQRIGIARALALSPRFIVADEPVSALDVSVQAQILNLLQELQESAGLTYLFISHDLGVVEHVSDRVGVMYVGRLVELARTEDLFDRPRHPYTEALLRAVPRLNAGSEASGRREIMQGDVANPADPPSGCYFHPRCRYAQPECREKAPVLEEVSPGHTVACHRASSLTLAGV